MNMIRWEPFRDVDEFFRQMGGPSMLRWPRWFGDKPESLPDWSPAADISETDKEFLVKAELPGVKREDVKVSLEDGVLCIEGERKYEKEDKGEKTHRVERFYGTFSRSFSLPENIDAKSIHAETKDGVLNVHVPKLKIEKPRPVQIKVE